MMNDQRNFYLDVACAMVAKPQVQHQQPRTTRLLDEEGEFQRERERLVGTQKCGGGRRIVRKRIGND